jgi:DNA-binding XRE family transcriptional regulator
MFRLSDYISENQVVDFARVLFHLSDRKSEVSMSTLQNNELDIDEAKRKFLSVLGHFTKKRRKALGMTEEELGERAAISPANILRFELGDWDIDTLSFCSLCRCLKTSAAAIFEEIEQARQ